MGSYFGFIQRQWLYQINVALEDVLYAPRDCTTPFEIRSDEDRIGTQALRSHCWYGRAGPEAPRLVRSRAHDRAVAFPSDNHGFAAQLRIIALLDGGVKRVHVDMDDFSHNPRQQFYSGSVTL